MRTITLAVVISISTVAAMAFTASNVLADDREGLIGTWKLVEAVNEDLSTHEKTDIIRPGRWDSLLTGQTDGSWPLSSVRGEKSRWEMSRRDPRRKRFLAR
jgi:hypothetical protein